MTNWNRTSLLVGILAGVTAVFLSLGAGGQSSFAIILYAASALPILIAGLGWGSKAAIAAVCMAGVTGALIVSPYFALMIVVITLLPAGWLSHLANLARPASELGGPEDRLAWYPLSDILTHLAGLVTAGMLIVGVLIGYDETLSNRLIEAVLEQLKVQEPLYNPEPATIDQIKSLFSLALPMLQGAIWVMILFLAFYAATRIVQASGKNLRPRDNIPSSLRMNKFAIFIFLGALIAMFFGGTLAAVGALVCGTFGAGFLLAGFASIHFRTRGKPWRLPVLWILYLSVVLFTLPALFLLLTGLADTRRTMALSSPKKSDTPET